MKFFLCHGILCFAFFSCSVKDQSEKTIKQNEMQTTNHTNLFSQIKACSTCTFEYRDTSRSVLDIQQHLGRNDLPVEFTELLTTTESMDITGKEEVIHFMSLKDLRLINSDITELPFLFFFGDDRGE